MSRSLSPTARSAPIIGPNGAGKTTFFNLITGAFAPDAGRILLAGEDIAGLDRREIVRRGIGRAFQIASIFPSLTVEEALAAAVQAHQRRETVKLQSFPLAARRARAGEIMEMLRLTRGRRASSAATSPTATRSCSISASLWRSIRGCCCSTSRPPAWGPEERWQMIETVQALWRART